ncbi:MAG: M81 family metallopeptidase [Thermomicrobium sp.]|nr:M81 family metallopeptidase [Thermomicrobium sp.]MDW8007317.1 M81 family metallopeptidase [Thermomicrobium sp.]
MPRPRIAITGPSHETNAFASQRVDLAFAERCGIARGSAVLVRARDTATVLAGFIEAAAELDFELVPLLAVWITPAGVVTREAYETLVGELIAGLRAAAPINGVLLSLHGAMVAEHVLDADGELSRRVRATVGAQVPIIAALDLYANISPLMVEQADILIGYHTYPHLDQRARGQQAARLLARLLRREIRPTVSLVKPPMLPTSQCMTTDRPPMRVLLDRAQQLESDPRVLDVTIAGGFPPADVPEAGLSILVTTDDDPVLAQQLADELAALAWELRSGFLGGVASWEEAADAIRSIRRGPLVLVDIADNPWSGGPGDSVELLRFLLREGVRPAALALVHDPDVVDHCFAAGTGATVEVLLGGKTDDLHGPPLQVRGIVRLLSDGRYVNAGPMLAGVTVDLGRTVVLLVDGIDVLVTERAESPIDLNVFRAHGIEPTEQRVVALKGKGHFRAAFEPIAERIVLVEGPGITGSDLNRLPFRNIRRPIWPLDPL